MDKIPLSEMLAELRKQLLEAQDLGKDAPLKFLIEDVELEVQLATTRGADGSVGVKFWVYNADAKVKASDVKTQTLKLQLKVVGRDGKSPAQIASEGAKPR